MVSERKGGLSETLRKLWQRLESNGRGRGDPGRGALPAVATPATPRGAASCRQDSILILSHTDPQVSVSGVDRFVLAEIAALEEIGLEVWVLSPRAGLTPRTYTWRRGAQLIGDGCSPDFVQTEVETLLCSGRVRAVAVHHLLGFEPALLEALGTLSGADRLLFYLHDEHLVQLAQLTGAFSFLAGNFGWDTPTFTSLLPRLQAAVDQLLRASDEVLLPSSALQAHLAPALHRAGVSPEKCRVVPEVSFAPYRSKDPVVHERPRLAYLGHALPNKGWLVWQGLLKDARILEKFDLFHIGAVAGGQVQGVTGVPYSTCAGNPYASVALLHDHEIDLVLLWSTVLESASYTMAEAHAAGLPVLTGVASGNIAAAVGSGEVSGQVLGDEEALREFLLHESSVDTLVEIGAQEPLRRIHHESFLCRMLEARP